MIVAALVPVFAIILSGFLISRIKLVSAELWPGLEKLTYYFFFPALLVLNLAESNFDWIELREITQVVLSGLVAISLIVILFSKLIARDRSALSSVYQGSIRFNTYIGLACIDALFGDQGLATAALCLAVYVPLVNVASVISLSLHSTNGRNRWVTVFSSTVSNPLVIACFIGISISYTGFRIPDLALESITILSQPALTLGLLAVGAGIHASAMGAQIGQLCAALLNKMLLFPAAVFAACLLFDTETELATILILLTTLPAPPSAYILARQLGGNTALMANIITVQTPVALLAIPFWLEMCERFL